MRTPPGGFEAPGGALCDQDEIPTRPDSVDPFTAQLARVFGDLSSVDRRRAVMLVTNWSQCTLDRRVLLEALSRELREEQDANRKI